MGISPEFLAYWMPELSAEALVVYLTLALHADAHGAVTMSHEEIAARTAIPLRTLQRMLAPAELDRCGLGELMAPMRMAYDGPVRVGMRWQVHARPLNRRRQRHGGPVFVATAPGRAQHRNDSAATEAADRHGGGFDSTGAMSSDVAGMGVAGRHGGVQASDAVIQSAAELSRCVAVSPSEPRDNTREECLALTATLAVKDEDLLPDLCGGGRASASDPGSSSLPSSVAPESRAIPGAAAGTTAPVPAPVPAPARRGARRRTGTNGHTHPLAAEVPAPAAEPLVLLPDPQPALGRDDCLARLAEAMGPEIFSAGAAADLSRGVAIGLNAVVARYRTEPDVWRLVGEYVRAQPPRDRPRFGNRPFLTPAWVASQAFLDTVIAARAWAAARATASAARQDGRGAAATAGGHLPPSPMPPAAVAPAQRARLGAVRSEAVDYTPPEDDPAARLLRDK